MQRLLPSRSVTFIGALGAGVFPPVLATLVSLGIPERSQMIPAVLYLLGVVVAAALGRGWSGPLAAVLSFLGLNFFFTVPRFTFRVARAEDLMALLVFLFAAAIVGALVSRSLAERNRAQQRERETAMLNSLAAELRTEGDVSAVLTTFLRSLVDSFGLAGCDVRAAAAEGMPELAVSWSPSLAEGGGPRLEVPMVTGSGLSGYLAAWRSTGGTAFSTEEERLFLGIASQTAVAIERARLDQQVRAAVLESQSYEARAALFSSVTHDLRTPLASIKAGVSSLLQPDAVYDMVQQRELLTTVLEETDRLDRLVGNILDLARGRAGALRPHRTLTAIEDVLDAVMARTAPVLAGLHVRTIIRPDIPDILVDPVQIDQVLTNVLENAGRFAPRGSDLLITAAAVGPWIEVRVADQGPGVPPEERERVFEAFHRDEGARGGTGLGLTIARSIAEAHGGKIWIEGAPGGGAAIILRLPVDLP